MTTISNYPAPRSTIPPPLADAIEALAGASWAPPPSAAACMSEALAAPAVPREFAEELAVDSPTAEAYAAEAHAAEAHAGWTLLWMQQGAVQEWRVKPWLIGLAVTPALACLATAALCLYYAAASQMPTVAAQLLVPGQPLAAIVAPPTSHDDPIEQRRDDARQLARRLGLGNMPAVNRIYLGHPDPTWVEAAGEHAQVPTSLLWPVEGGGYVRGYGSGEGGYHLAMDISGKLGWDVRASAGGIVGYAGDRLRGYGNIVMLIHPGGWVTIYAHNQRNYVTTGQRVEAGEVIAALGSTGISRGPHVHYEFIHNGMNCDSAALMRPGVMHRSGYQSPITKVEWAAPASPPRAVACGRRRYHPRSRWHPSATSPASPELAELQAEASDHGSHEVREALGNVADEAATEVTAAVELDVEAAPAAPAIEPQAAAEVEPAAAPTTEDSEASAPEARVEPAPEPAGATTAS